MQVLFRFLLLVGAGLVADHSVADYTSTRFSSNAHLGYAYPAVDGDGDGLIDGMEFLIETPIEFRDSDNDGLGDASEFPLVGISTSDPCIGTNSVCY